MTTFFGALLAGLAWMGLTSQFGWGAFALGALLGLAIQGVAPVRGGRPFSVRRAGRLVALGLRILAMFLWELLEANLLQLRIVLAPRIDIRPGWIRFRSELETPALRALLGVLITLTPGSLTYEESPGPDGGWLISLHVLDLRDEAQMVEQIRRRFEAPLLAMEDR